MKIGIFVGCFNPVHIDHKTCAKQLLSEGIVDKVIFVPAGDKYEKTGLLAAEFRLKMLEIALFDEPNFEISDVEIKRGKMYSFETLNFFKKKFEGDDIYLVIGSDNLKSFNLWKNFEYMLENFKIVVLSRDGVSLSDFPEYANCKNLIFVTCNRQVSSTNIRRLIAGGRDEEARQFLEPEVFDFIEKNNLFKK